MAFTRLTFELTGRGVFELEGSFELTPDVLALLDRWLANMANDDAAKLAALTARLKSQNDALQASTHAHEGTEPQPVT